jgi:hypothetical protein
LKLKRTHGTTVYRQGICVSCFGYDVDDMAMRLVKVLGPIATSISTSNAPIQFESITKN